MASVKRPKKTRARRKPELTGWQLCAKDLEGQVIVAARLLRKECSIESIHRLMQMRNLAHGAKNPSNDFVITLVYMVEFVGNVLRGKRSGETSEAWAVDYLSDYAPPAFARFFAGASAEELRALVAKLIGESNATALGVVTDLVMARLARPPALVGTSLSSKSTRRQVQQTIDSAIRKTHPQLSRD